MLKKRKKIYDGKIIKLYKDIININNRTFIREIIVHPGSVVLIPILNKKAKETILIKQFRYAIGKYIFELPAGTLEKNENPISCAKRELKEETGYIAKKIKKIAEIYPSPGIITEKMHIFIATDLIKSQQELDIDENIAIIKMKLGEAIKMIKKGKITDAKTIVGLLLLKNFN
ncbi:MAG: NUDIX hydrolase [Candidatus Goldbacteria bacterium]|nr:NUDIX hydrolase [Candidatus Goldiibacteriota bacterium]